MLSAVPSTLFKDVYSAWVLVAFVRLALGRLLALEAVGLVVTVLDCSGTVRRRVMTAIDCGGDRWDAVGAGAEAAKRVVGGGCHIW